MDAKATRYSELDLYKGIGIIATVTASSGMLSSALQYRFDAVCFPLFMMAAGALWHKRGFKTDEKNVLKSSFKQIFMPYVWFSLICLLIEAAAMFINPEEYGLFRIYNDIWDTVTLVGMSVLWFLPAYFIAVSAFRVFRHNFGLLILCVFLTIVAFSITLILYYKGYQGLYDLGNMAPGFESFGLRMALLFWRGSLGMFFCVFGEVFCLIAEKLSEKKLLMVVLSVLLIGAGVGLTFLIDHCDYFEMRLDQPFITLPLSLCLGGGLLLLCSWIGTVRPIDYLGRHAVIIYLTFTGLGIMKAALAIGDIVFQKTDNNFANRATVAVVVLAAELVVIRILKLKAFSFLIGERDFTVAEAEEEVL